MGEGEISSRPGSLLGSLRWDSGWQGGSGRKKRRSRKREGVGEAKRDMVACASYEKGEERVRQRMMGLG